ncbi:MAG: DUF411 domain-containing protein [Deltaproteobacteria bacterium]|nr:DUF411 domain-containing protein [Deltaproteobacteria bacterium]
MQKSNLRNAMLIGLLIILSSGAVALYKYSSKYSSGNKASAVTLPQVMVYKNPTCGCCKKWEQHMRRNGFTVQSDTIADVANIKTKYQVPKNMASCHTAIIGKYVIEGHVPADTIKRLLAENPSNVVGLVVPEMPNGSAGMEDPSPVPYQVLAFDISGKTTLYEQR